jgi:polyhydroxyalkanoate synthesis regulator phasin
MTKNPISQLADLGEEMLGKAAQNPTAAKVLGGAMQLKDRVDELQRRVRGLEGLEQRLEALEQRVAELEPKKRTPAKKAASAKES